MECWTVKSMKYCLLLRLPNWIMLLTLLNSCRLVMGIALWTVVNSWSTFGNRFDVVPSTYGQQFWPLPNYQRTLELFIVVCACNMNARMTIQFDQRNVLSQI